MTSSPIRHYELLPASFYPYDPRAEEVARRVAELVTAEMPEACVEHIGSTSVPGCSGKGIVDLQLLYPPGRLEEARDALDRLGFQRQQGRDPFPESRPMRVGAIEHDGTIFRLHVHVVAADQQEAEENRAFRDTLRADLGLRERYMARKQQILNEGITFGEDYAIAKSAFVVEVLENIAGHGP